MGIQNVAGGPMRLSSNLIFPVLVMGMVPATSVLCCNKSDEQRKIQNNTSICTHGAMMIEKEYDLDVFVVVKCGRKLAE